MIEQEVALELLGLCNYLCWYCVGPRGCHRHTAAVLHDLPKLAQIYDSLKARGPVDTRMYARGTEPALHPQIARIAAIASAAGPMLILTNLSIPVAQWLSDPTNITLKVTIHPEAEEDIDGFLDRVCEARDLGYGLDVIFDQSRFYETDYSKRLADMGIKLGKLRLIQPGEKRPPNVTPSGVSDMTCMRGYSSFFIRSNTILCRCTQNLAVLPRPLAGPPPLAHVLQHVQYGERCRMKTNLLGVRDPGRSGGSWFIHFCNVHPAGMRILGEVHLPSQLDFPYPCPAKEYDGYVIQFLKDQMSQGVAAAGIVKCFRPWAERFILSQGGRIMALIRNPMEVAGSNMYKKPRSFKRFAKREPRNKFERFQGHLMYYRHGYEYIYSKREEEPLVRLEDLNRSCGGDGQFLKTVVEWITQTAFSPEYIRFIQKWYLPGYHYGAYAVKDEHGMVIDVECLQSAYEPWRFSWHDDPRPREHWDSWTPDEQAAFVEYLGPICTKLGYNCTTNPGYVETNWSLRHSYSWARAADTLQPIPYVPVSAERDPKLPPVQKRKPSLEALLPVFQEEAE